MREKIAIIDYGLGNIRSIFNMLKYIGYDAFISSKPEDLEKANKLIFPGVGAFDSGISRMKTMGLLESIHEEVMIKGKFLLAICLGMQILGKSSEEGNLEGLSWIPQRVVKFDLQKNNSARFRIPHMGWNKVIEVKSHVIFSKIRRPLRFYFVHSYHYAFENNEWEYGITSYGYDFTSVIVKDNIIGVQFHPEKSHNFGMQFIRNFLELK